MIRFLSILLAAAFLTGCAARRADVTANHDATAEAPPPAIRSADFETLWAACESAVQAKLFELDRQDRRLGVLTTKPMVSAQWFEIWRPELKSCYDIAESSLATMRRTVRFEFEKLGENEFVVRPTVLVERYSQAERRVTSSALYRSVHGRPNVRGTPESDRGVYLPSSYWYPVARDLRLEESIARDVARRIGGAAELSSVTE